MVIFNIFLYVYQRVGKVNWALLVDPLRGG